MLTGRLTEAEFTSRAWPAHRKLRAVLTDAGVDLEVHEDRMPAAAVFAARQQLDRTRSIDGADIVTRVRNRLVHPKEAQEPVYSVKGLVTGALTVSPANHAAHRAHTAQQGAGDQAEQHRQRVCDQMRSARIGHGADRHQERGELVGRAQLLTLDTQLIGELAGGGQGRAGWHAGAAFTILRVESHDLDGSRPSTFTRPPVQRPSTHHACLVL